MKRIDAKTLHAWLLDGHELALLDAREDGEFGASHLFWAVPCPLSKREMRARALLPRLAVRICCVDDGRGPRRAARRVARGHRLHAMSPCSTAAPRPGKPPATSCSRGVNVPSKAFGEWVEHHYGTESVDPPELKSWIDGGQNIVVLDSRTHEEFVRMSIPTGISVPGGELVYRIGDIAPDPKTLVVVNCAGRTRSIMGAESLRRAGIPNKVVALRNGTMGWELAGFRCDRGRTERFAPGKPKTAATRIAASAGVRGTIRRRRDRRHRPRRASRMIPTARCMCWMSAIPRSTAPVIARGASARRAGNWCRRPINGSACATRASCWSTIAACVRVWRGPGCVRWAIVTCSWWRAAWTQSHHWPRTPRRAGAGRQDANDRRDRPGRAARQRRRHGGDRSRPQHRFPRGAYPRRAMGRADAARCAEAATCRR